MTPAIPDTSPARYVARIDRSTGSELRGPIPPEELLVRAHRDRHVLEVVVQFMASRLVELTGSERLAHAGVRGLRRLGGRLAATVGALSGRPALERSLREVLGVERGRSVFRFRESGPLLPREKEARLHELRRRARAALEALGPKGRFRVLLTGATGFLGKEVLVRALLDPRVEEVVCVVRRETVRDPRGGRGTRMLGARQRGTRLLSTLGIDAAGAARVRFLEGNVERPGLGLRPAQRARLRRSITHMVHCAASVAFDDSYESSFHANVLGSRNALDLALDLQEAPGSPFVCAVAVETSYIHGRTRSAIAREDRLVFPSHFYNNYYELTKAMAALEAERALLERGLRVAQLLPSIVIGDSRTGNNRGDTKVVNAPVNAMGRVRRALEGMRCSSPGGRLRAAFTELLGTRFPADPTAELNLVSLDRVGAGVLAALDAPEAIGARIHLAADHRICSRQMIQVMREELELDVRMADPTLTRLATLPLATALLGALGEPKLARAFERLGAIFGSYSEWGQPVHGVGEDVAILSLPARRPDPVEGFRMLCRHSRFVQEFGGVRDPEEIARRERVWEGLIDEIEFRTGRRVASLPAPEFRRLLRARIELRGFRER
jgi:nucleoside-diphosphate-sugar epimerase